MFCQNISIEQRGDSEVYLRFKDTGFSLSQKRKFRIPVIPLFMHHSMVCKQIGKECRSKVKVA